jgi:hypothetical protein
VTELKTEDNLLVITGKIRVRNTGSSTAYLGNVIDKIHTKPSRFGRCSYTGSVNVLTYDETETTVDTCKIIGSGSKTYTDSNDGNLTLVDQYGADPFATSGTYPGGLYAIPAHSTITFNYTSIFDLDLVGLSDDDYVTDEVLVTFIDSPGGPNTCDDIDSTGEGVLYTTHQTRAWPETIQFLKCLVAKEVCDLPSSDTSEINLYDRIVRSPDQDIVRVENFKVDSFTLRVNGNNRYTTTISATGTPGTSTIIELNSSATCKLPRPECDGYTPAYATEVIQYEQGLRKDGSAIPGTRNDSSKALGAPQDDDTLNFVSLGFGGNLTLKFDQAIMNRAGYDLQVWETSYNSPNCSDYPEWVKVYASKTGHPGSWVYLGTQCQNNTGKYNLGSLNWAQYIKLEDVSNKASSNFPDEADGFDVDGVKGRRTCPIDDYEGGNTFVRNRARLALGDDDCCKETCDGYGYGDCEYPFCDDGYG